jgi:hypothetical protein
MAIRGRFVWEELTTTNPASAARFYAKVAGLKAEPAPHDPAYTLLVASGGRMGGMMALADAKIANASPNWLSYISTLNVDETVRQAESLGASIIKAPAAMGDGGRFAFLQDPQGAVFAIYQSPRPDSTPPPVSLGGMSWHELATNDFVGAFSFYQTLFGWHVMNDMDMGPGMGIYRLFAAEGSNDQMGGMYTKPPQQPGPPAWLPYIKVANVKAATGKAKALGATIMHGPAEVPGGWITMGADPQGAMFAVHSTPGAATSPKPKAKARPAKKKRAVASPKRKAKKSAKAGPKKKKAGAKK